MAGAWPGTYCLRLGFVTLTISPNSATNARTSAAVAAIFKLPMNRAEGVSLQGGGRHWQGVSPGAFESGGVPTSRGRVPGLTPPVSLPAGSMRHAGQPIIAQQCTRHPSTLSQGLEQQGWRRAPDPSTAESRPMGARRAARSRRRSCSELSAGWRALAGAVSSSKGQLGVPVR